MVCGFAAYTSGVGAGFRDSVEWCSEFRGTYNLCPLFVYLFVLCRGVDVDIPYYLLPFVASFDEHGDWLDLERVDCFIEVVRVLVVDRFD